MFLWQWGQTLTIQAINKEGALHVGGAFSVRSPISESNRSPVVRSREIL